MKVYGTARLRATSPGAFPSSIRTAIFARVLRAKFSMFGLMRPLPILARRRIGRRKRAGSGNPIGALIRVRIKRAMCNLWAKIMSPFIRCLSPRPLWGLIKTGNWSMSSRLLTGSPGMAGNSRPLKNVASLWIRPLILRRQIIGAGT